MADYIFKDIEAKWQAFWEEHGTFRAHNFSLDRPKYYPLVEFPYPSGAGLHVGHPRPYTALDVIARKRRMQGYNVLYGIGWDAFGLPTENYAIKTGRPPAEVTKENIATFTQQIKSLGISFDWSREIDTTDPQYYKWTQWIFLQLFKYGLAYKSNMPINWCLSCKIGLANEEVVDGRCERCGGEVEKRDKEQWMLAITKYADRLLADLDTVDYIERAKIQQTNWIGRSEGAEIDFALTVGDASLRIYTTRPDTIFGATYMVIAPEHKLLNTISEHITNWSAVEVYQAEARKMKEMDRVAEGREKTGVRLEGVMAVNPANREEIPVFVADYVLATYGTGAIMAVPAHDERDWEFAKEFELPIVDVIAGRESEEDAWTGKGALINSGEFNGLEFAEAKEKVVKHVGGNPKTQYKLRDWVFSRQRYWGEPIPLVWCEKDEKWVALPEDQLPLTLPEVEKYEPTDTGESPLSTMDDWVSTTCPECDGPARRETDTMPNWAGSSWYFLRYCAPDDDQLFTKDKRWKREAIEPNQHDTAVWETYLKIKERFGKERIDFWICGSLSVNAINRGLWKHMDDLDIHVHTENYERALSVMENMGMALNKRREGSMEITHGEVDIELIEITVDESGRYAYYSNGQRIEVTMNDYEWVERGELFGETVRTVSPWHVLWQYMFLDKYFAREKDGDDDKKQFLTEYLEDPINYWMGVDWYNGGMEHTVLHLLYSRFWNKFLFDIGVSPVCEPYNKRTSHGLILAEGGEKMSKSKGNVVNPNEVVAEFGADTLRTYEMFIGPFDQHAAWSTSGLAGVHRFLRRVWDLQEKVTEAEVNKQMLQLLHKTIAKVHEDTEEMRFNTAVAAMMEFNNQLVKAGVVPALVYREFIKILSPFAPHMCEELWERFGDVDASISQVEWPKADLELLVVEQVTIAVQVNGKMRATINIAADTSQEEMQTIALAQENVQKWLNGKEPKKVIVVPGKMVSVVV